MKPKNEIVTAEEWTKRRARVLKKEKALTKKRDALAAEVRALPWKKLPKPYVFQTRRGPASFAALFEGKSQLAVYHFMLGPGWKAGCKNCSFWGDQFGGLSVHLPHRDVTFKVISRAPIDEIERYRARLGWSFDWVSSFGSEFNFDLGVSEGDDEAPGISVFARQGKEIFHTYFTTGRGLEVLNPTYGILDLVPRGRDEGKLQHPMDWIKRHDEYSTR